MILNYDQILEDIQVFTVGEHTDARGHKDKYTQADLELMVEAFNEKVVSSVPIKTGHSSDKFVQQVADELGIPKSLIDGEGDNRRGAVRLGEITKLHAEEGKLYANFRLHDKVGNMVNDKLFTGISSEITKNRDKNGKLYPYVLSGMALLGVQRPSLSHIPSLPSQMFEDEEGNLYEGSSYDQELHYAPERGVDGRFKRKEDPDSGREKIYDVPIRYPDNKKSSGFSQVYARVAAPDETTAKSVALRAIENFLFSAGNPAGEIIGGAIGALVAKKIFFGKPKLSVGTSTRGVGRILKSVFEEELEQMTLRNNPEQSFLLGDGHNPDSLYTMDMIPPGINEQAWRECLKEAGLSGHIDAEAY